MSNNLRTAVLSLAALAVGTCLSASIDATFAGRTWYVSAYAPSGGDGSRETPFRTIQEAVNAASAGDTVKISEGVFETGTSSSSSPAGFASLSRENVTKRLRITGAGRGKTVIEGAAGFFMLRLMASRRRLRWRRRASRTLSYATRRGSAVVRCGSSMRRWTAMRRARCSSRQPGTTARCCSSARVQSPLRRT